MLAKDIKIKYNTNNNYHKLTSNTNIPILMNSQLIFDFYLCMF